MRGDVFLVGPWLSIVLLAVLGVASSSAWGEEDNPDKDSDLPDWAIKKIDPVYDLVSGWVDSTSRGIDGFFGSDESLKVDNHSYLRLSQEYILRQNLPDDEDLAVRYRLQLPTTEKRLKLIVESDPEETQGTLEQQAARDTRSGRFDGGQGAVIGLERQGKKEDKRQAWVNRFSGGVKLHLPPDPYVRYTAERLWQLGNSPWSLEFNGRLSWFNSDGYSARSLMDIGRPIDEKNNLRFVTQFQWQEDYDKLEFYQRAEWSQIINSRSAIRYSGVLVGQSAHNPRIDDYYVEAVYRRNIHKGLLFLDVSPGLHFPREADFDPSFQISVRIEIFFRGDIVNKN
ncbi:hypothetical protein [Gallaecimonas mangrovi]|uniref:hypothetical protein n=1 Tax=Gallaecimonas mangrovi TaxID=2291597 RepID=UPI001D022DA0|nr:hypothetical protein [Gallaecimonas mangrovi]